MRIFNAVMFVVCMVIMLVSYVTGKVEEATLFAVLAVLNIYLFRELTKEEAK